MSDDAFTQEVSDLPGHTGHERWLAAHDELERLTELTDVFRGVTTAVTSATTREALAEAVCERLADSSLYRTACLAAPPTWTGTADRWTVAGDATDAGQTPSTLEPAAFEGVTESPTLVPADGSRTDGWAVVPVVFDRTVYGALGLLPSCPFGDDHELDVLRELGGVIGHAIHALELRRLLADEAVVELELEHTHAGDPLVDAAGRAGCRFELAGLVPTAENDRIAYLHVENATAEAAAERLAAASGDSVRTVREGTDGDGGLVAWSVVGDGLVGLLANHGGHITRATADGDAASYTVEVASDAAVRALIERVQHEFPDTRLRAKRELDRPVDSARGFSAGGIATLTARQLEVLEAAYRAGYFRWPRDSSAEEVAEMLDISRPTLHAHLRKAEEQLFGELFDGDSLRS